MNSGDTGFDVEERLAELLTSKGLGPLPAEQLGLFARYLELLQKWNARLNLTAIRDTQGILERHFVECIACARAIPEEARTVLDLGSGAGFPGIPIAICRPEMAVTLAESQGKKAVFLREVVRSLGLGAEVHGGRAEALGRSFDSVVLRAVDRMERAVAVGAELVRPAGWLVLMTTRGERGLLEGAAGPGFAWGREMGIPGGGDRVVIFGRRAG